MNAGLRPEITQAAPMSIVAAMTPPSKIAPRIPRSLLCTTVSLTESARLGADRAVLNIQFETL
jgi:hypothetical protein